MSCFFAAAIIASRSIWLLFTLSMSPDLPFRPSRLFRICLAPVLTPKAYTYCMSRRNFLCVDPGSVQTRCQSPRVAGWHVLCHPGQHRPHAVVGARDALGTRRQRGSRAPRRVPGHVPTGWHTADIRSSVPAWSYAVVSGSLCSDRAEGPLAAVGCWGTGASAPSRRHRRPDSPSIDGIKLAL